MDGISETILEIERMGENELSDIHWKVFNRVMQADWKNESDNDYLEMLLNEIRARMAAE